MFYFHLCIFFRAVVLAFNLPGFNSRLNLTRDIIVGIYNGTIQWWNDTNIQQVNPTFYFPERLLTVVARGDNSGTTLLFTEALSSFSSEWKYNIGSFATGKNASTGVHDHWKKGVVSYFGQTNSGVAGIIMSLDYSIGYLSVADAKQAGIHTAFVENGEGHFSEASPENVQNSMDYHARLSNDISFQLHNPGGASSYPIAGFTHFIAYKTTMTICDSAREFVRYTYWAFTDEDQREACIDQGMAPLSVNMIERITERVLKEFKCHGQSVWQMVQRDIIDENKTKEAWILPISVSVPLFVIVNMCFCGYLIYQRISFLRKLYNDDWFIPIEDIVFFYDQKQSNSMRSKFFCGKSIFSIQSTSQISDCPELIQQVLQWPGKWSGNIIGLRLTKIKQLNKVTRIMKGKMLVMKDKIQHNNIVRFYGLTDLDNDKYVISEYCSKGQLTELIQNDKFNLTNELKLSLAIDIAQGMAYLHSKNMIHGSLKSSVCLIDSKWTVKICDWEYNALILCHDEDINSSYEIRKNAPAEETKYVKHYLDFWTAPEIIRMQYMCGPTTASDVYSYSIILQEIYTREDPYSEIADLMTPEDVINAIVYMGRIRPKPPDDMPISVRQCMEISWSESPEDRPSFEQILKMIRKSGMSSKSVLDSMMEAIEEYTVLLEERLEERAAEFNLTIQGLQKNLSTYMPMSTVTLLTNGHSTGPRQLSNVGIICIDIRNFYKLISGVKKLNNKIKIIENFHQHFHTIAVKYSAFTYIMSFDTVVFILGIGSKGKNITSIAFETANMCLQLNAMLDKCVRPKPIEHGLGSTVDVLHERILADNGRYQIIGSALEHVTTLSRKAKHSTILIPLSLCVKIKSFDSFIVSEITDIQVIMRDMQVNVTDIRLIMRDIQVIMTDIQVNVTFKYDKHTGNYEGHTGKCYRHIGKCDRHTGNYEGHVGSYDRHTGNYEGHTVNYEGFTGKCDKHAGTYDRHRGNYDK